MDCVIRHGSIESVRVKSKIYLLLSNYYTMERREIEHLGA